MTEEQYQAIRQEHGYKLSGLVASARGGFNAAYDAAKADGFPAEQVLTEASQVRANAVYDVIASQYGDIDLKAKGIGGLLAAAKAGEVLNELLRDLEALTSTSEEEYNKLLNNVRDNFVSQQVAAAGIRI